jgi:hypothetical protein
MTAYPLRVAINDGDRRQTRLILRWVGCGGCALLALSFLGLAISVGVALGMPLFRVGG